MISFACKCPNANADDADFHIVSHNAARCRQLQVSWASLALQSPISSSALIVHVSGARRVVVAGD